MAEKAVLISQQSSKPIKISKWKVSQGSAMSIGRVILTYHLDGAEKKEQRKLKSTRAGTVHRLIAQEGAIVKTGCVAVQINPGKIFGGKIINYFDREPLLELKPCIHPTVMKDMCAECGADLRKDDIITTASVPMVHSIPELKVSEELAQKLGKADGDRLLKDRKLVLLVDLDQTLIHTTNDNIPPNIKDVYHFQLYGPTSPWYHTRLRPGTHQFLNNVSPLYELHICTFGARNYAHTITMFLDTDQRYFSNRILSRDECFDPTSKKANLKALFPCGDNMVCIIDDREDVWSHALNLIHVKPYHFFQHTGDINAPPGLDKHESDDKECVDLTKIKVKSKISTKKFNGRDVGLGNIPDDKVKNNMGTGNNIDHCEIKTAAAKNQTESDKNEEERVEETADNELLENGNIKISSKSNKDEISCENLNIKGKRELKESEATSEYVRADDGKTRRKNNGEIKNTETRSESETKLNTSEDSVSNMETNENVVDTQYSKAESETDITENQEKQKECESETPNNSKEVSEEKNKTAEEGPGQQKEEFIEVEDPDDYLMYLEDILKKIHEAFYDEFDKMESGQVPDLKAVIPVVRSQVLKDCNLVFSGLVPTHIKLHQSKAYQVARSLGANVTQELGDDTTHLVAVRPGTAKVNAGRRRKHIKIVTPDWLWACAERWEHVNEKIFPLNSKGSKNRHPPPHCSSPEHVPNYPVHDTPALRKRTPSGRFMDTINPLMSFSSDDIADMDKEVEDILDDESDESEEEKIKIQPILEELNKSKEEESSSSEESLTGEYPRGFKRTREKREAELREELEEDIESSVDEFPSTKFRRGEQLDSDLDIGDSNSEGSAEAPDEVDDGEWNMMGAALEREFLSNN